MAACTIYSTVIFGHPIEWLIQLVNAAMTAFVVTARLQKPWIGVVGHIKHGAMAVHTVNLVLGGCHDVTQAARAWAWMAIVTTVE